MRPTVKTSREANMAIYSIGDLDRRDMLKMSAVLAGSGALFSTKVAAAEAALLRTPGQILGPFYPLGELTQNSDLTRVPGTQRHGASAEPLGRAGPHGKS